MCIVTTQSSSMLVAMLYFPYLSVLLIKGDLFFSLSFFFSPSIVITFSVSKYPRILYMVIHSCIVRLILTGSCCSLTGHLRKTNECHFVLQLLRFIFCVERNGHLYFWDHTVHIWCLIYVLQSVYQWIVKPQTVIKSNEMFLPGRMSFIFDMVNFPLLFFLAFDCVFYVSPKLV